MHELCTLVFSLLERKLAIIIDLANTLLVEGRIPKYVPLIIKDLASFRLGLHRKPEPTKEDSLNKNFIKVPFHNKGIEMVHLPQILHSKPIRKAIPDFIK